MYYAKYYIREVTDDDIAWWQEVFGTRAELEMVFDNQEISHNGKTFVYKKQSHIYAHIHSKDDALIFVLRFPSAFLGEEHYDL